MYEATRLGFELSKAEQTNFRELIKEKRGNKSNGTYHNINVISAAIRFAGSLARIFEDSYKKYYPEDEDIDKKLRREIHAVKNGQNLVM